MGVLECLTHRDGNSDLEEAVDDPHFRICLCDFPCFHFVSDIGASGPKFSFGLATFVAPEAEDLASWRKPLSNANTIGILVIQYTIPL